MLVCFRQEKVKSVAWFIETNSATQVERSFRTKYGHDPPSWSLICEWHKWFMETDSVQHEKHAIHQSRCQKNTKPVLRSSQHRTVGQNGQNPRHWPKQKKGLRTIYEGVLYIPEFMISQWMWQKYNIFLQLTCPFYGILHTFEVLLYCLVEYIILYSPFKNVQSSFCRSTSFHQIQFSSKRNF